MRKSDIEELLSEVEEIVASLETQKSKANTNSGILEISKPKVKSALEHLRSCLDYAAHDIYDFLYKDRDGKTEEQRGKMSLYFPYGKSLGDFHSSLGRSFKNLQSIHNEIYQLILSVQSFNSRKTWIYDICNITNKIKHVEQRKQERLAMRTVKLTDAFSLNYNRGSNTNIIISGNVINGVKQSNDFVISGGQIRSDMSKIKEPIELVDWTDFAFKDSNIRIIDLIKTSYEHLRKFIDDLYLLLA